MIGWEKLGRVFVPDGSIPWMRTHAQVPVADRLDADRLRIYFGSRDDRNRARIGWIDVDSEDPRRVLDVSREPLLPLGDRGTFDDSGMMPSCIVPVGRRKYLYYMGWNPQVTVSYRVSVGLAESEDGGRTYRRYAAGPVLDRNLAEPFFCASNSVLREDRRWRMWYTSCTGWVEVHGRPEPIYHIKYAESEDGNTWRRDGIVCIDYDECARAISRPWVMRLGDRYGMWFSYRGSVDYRTDPRTSYRIGYAESADGLSWERRPDPAGLGRSAEGWDSLMMAYPNVIRAAGRVLCFYNGNDFGKSGLGYAVAASEAPAA
jgi:predicted GH43/DUF377 family glycosyl hydrolase